MPLDVTNLLSSISTAEEMAEPPENPQNPIQVMIVEDCTIKAEGLVKLIQIDHHLEVVKTARTLNEAFLFLKSSKLKADVIFLDLRASDGRDAAAIASLRKCGGKARIIALTEFSSSNSAVTIGVDACLNCQSTAFDLRGTIRNLFGMSSTALGNGKDLSSREMKVAQLAAEGLTNSEIAQELFVAESTVKTHLEHVFRKLSIRGRVDLAARMANRNRQSVDNNLENTPNGGLKRHRRKVS